MSWLDDAMLKYVGISDSPDATEGYVDPLELARRAKVKGVNSLQPAEQTNQLSQQSQNSSSSSSFLPNQLPASNQSFSDNTMPEVSSHAIGEGIASNRKSSLQGMRESLGGGLLSQITGNFGLSDSQINKAGNMGIGQIISALAGPVGSLFYNGAQAFGFNPTQGLRESQNYQGAPGYQGGYWGNAGMGNGLNNFYQAEAAPVETPNVDLLNNYYNSMNSSSSVPSNGVVGTNNTYSGSGYGNTAGPGSNYTSPES